MITDVIIGIFLTACIGWCFVGFLALIDFLYNSFNKIKKNGR